MSSVNKANAQTAGPTPAPRDLAPVTRLQREAAMRLIRHERRRLEHRRDGRFEYLKRVYD